VAKAVVQAIPSKSILQFLHTLTTIQSPNMFCMAKFRKINSPKLAIQLLHPAEQAVAETDLANQLWLQGFHRRTG
jgi:hypothetical protein